MERPYIGGQAVLEGVMMRSPRSFVVAVRRPDGQIAIREQAWETLLPGLTFLRWPFFRGVVVLLESLHNGFSALSFSAEQASGQGAPGDDAPSSASRALMLGASLLLMITLFVATPHLLTLGVLRLTGSSATTQGALFHLVDGVLRIAILVGYLAAIARTPDARQLFRYHGAEHKAIWTYESGQALTVENARRFTTLHPRCGTSFLFVVVAVAVVLHILVLPWLPRLSEVGALQALGMILVKVALAFPVAGLAYELQKLSARPACPPWLRALTAPGLWLQRITTVEPTDAQLEIALLALERALAREEGRAHASDGVTLYPDFSGALAA